MEVSEVPQAWVEVNIAPTSLDRAERSLSDLVDSLVHDKFRERISTWFFGWYSQPQPYHLRLRIRWLRLERSDNDRDDLFGELNMAQEGGQFERWWQGSHGTEGEIYPDEEDTYGDLWELTCKDWQSSSELVLAIAKRDPDNLQSEQRRSQWERRVHLHSNRLRWNDYFEAFYCLVQARGRLALLSRDNPEQASFVDPIGESIQRSINQLASGPPASE
jgi:hypothetical protein